MTNATTGARRESGTYLRSAARPHVGQPLARQNDRFESFAFEVATDDRSDAELLDAYGEEDCVFIPVDLKNGVYCLRCPGCDSKTDRLTPEQFDEVCAEGRLGEVATCSWCSAKDLIEDLPVAARWDSCGIAVQCQDCGHGAAAMPSVPAIVRAHERGVLAEVAVCIDCATRGLV